MASIFQFLTRAFIPVLVLGFLWLWQRRRWFVGSQSRPTVDGQRSAELKAKMAGETDLDPQSLGEGRPKADAPSVPWSHICIEGAPLAGVLDPSITSGQLADMVKRREKHKDSAQSSKHQSRQSETLRQRKRLSSPWSHKKHGDSQFIETDVVELNHNSNSYGIWRRRVLRFVGQ